MADSTTREAREKLVLTINLVASVGSRKSPRHTAKEMKIIVRYFLLDRVPLRLDPAGFLFTLSCFAFLLSSSTLRRKFDQSSGIIAGLDARASACGFIARTFHAVRILLENSTNDEKQV